MDNIFFQNKMPAMVRKKKALTVLVKGIVPPKLHSHQSPISYSHLCEWVLSLATAKYYGSQAQVGKKVVARWCAEDKQQLHPGTMRRDRYCVTLPVVTWLTEWFLAATHDCYGNHALEGESVHVCYTMFSARRQSQHSACLLPHSKG